MDVYFRIQINIFSLIILGLIFIISYRNFDRKIPLNKSFLMTALGVIVGLFAEAMTCIFNGNPNPSIIILNNILSAITFTMAPIIAYYFFHFIFHLVMSGSKIKEYVKFLFLIPIVISVILSVLSPFFGFYFSYTADGVYERGTLFLLSSFNTYLFMVAGVLLVLINAKKMLKKDFLLILGIGILPILGGIAQSLFYGVLAMWSSAAVAMMFGYIFLDDRMIRLDSLTGAWNRESFYLTYTRRIQLTPEKKFGAIFFDIDNLKMINDNYGHLEGDKAIKMVMNVIFNVLPQGGNVCRFGGDEFIVLYDCDKQEEMDTILSDIKNTIKQNEQIKAKQYPLECSFGTALYTSDFTSLDAFLSKLDMLMYQDKNAKKSNK